MCLKESFFPDSWKVSYEVLVFDTVLERCTTKNVCPGSLFYGLCKIIEKFVKDGLDDYLKKGGLF